MDKTELIAVITAATVSISNMVLIILSWVDMKSFRKEMYESLAQIRERLAVIETKLGIAPLIKH